MIRRNDLTRGSVGKKIISLTLPMLIGMVGMMIFNLVDTFFISRLGTTALAAMGFIFPVVLFQGSISMGLGVGAAAVISRAIGQEDQARVKRLTTDSLFLSVMIVLILITLGELTIEQLFRSMGAEGEVLMFVKQYMFIWYLSVPFVVIPMVGNNAIRAAGNTFIPSMIMLTAIFVNVILDPLLIYGVGPFPRLELAGAALATLIARSLTLILALIMLRFRFNMLTSHLPGFRELLESWRGILYVGFPAAITQAIIPLSMGVITRLVAGYGPTAVAALGVGIRIEKFALSPLMALGAVMVPFVGQNHGAGFGGRIRKGIRFSHLFSLGLGVLLFVIFFFSGRLIGGLLSDDPAVTELIYLYLLITSAAYGLQGMLMVSSSAFNALRKPFHSFFLNILWMVGLYIPLALLGSYFLNLTGIFIGAASASACAGLVAAIWISGVSGRLAALKPNESLVE